VVARKPAYSTVMPTPRPAGNGRIALLDRFDLAAAVRLRTVGRNVTRPVMGGFAA